MKNIEKQFQMIKDIFEIQKDIMDVKAKLKRKIAIAPKSYNIDFKPKLNYEDDKNSILVEKLILDLKSHYKRCSANLHMLYDNLSNNLKQKKNHGGTT